MALRKLVKDDYALVEERYGKSWTGAEVLQDCYSISFDGLVFLQSGGYNSQAARNKAVEDSLRAHQRQLFFLNMLAGLGGAVAAIYYGLEIAKHFSKH